VVDKRLKLVFPSKPQSLEAIRAEVHSFISGTPYNGRGSDILLVVTEACANVVRHAYPENHKDPLIILESILEPDYLTIMVSDRGKGLILQDGDTIFSEDGGFGLFLMQKLSDRLKCYSSFGSGTVVEIGFKSPKHGSRLIFKKSQSAIGALVAFPLVNLFYNLKGNIASYLESIEAEITATLDNLRS